MRTKSLLIWIAFCASGWSSAWAEPLKVLTTGAFKSVMMEMVSESVAKAGIGLPTSC
jgi:hypothetical protein